MKYTLDNLFEDLRQGTKSWNEIKKQCAEAGITTESLKKTEKTEYVALLNNYRKKKCPQEYKENPHIHYEVPHFGKPNKKKD